MTTANITVIYPTICTGAALLWYMVEGALVGKARHKYGIKPPATTGNEEFDKVFRAQQNTLESLVIFVPSVYGFSYFVSPKWSLILGSTYVLSRVAYNIGYTSKNANNRELGFAGSFLTNTSLLVGTLYGSIRLLRK